uniref:Uncharacterized protein n=1 Tax=Arundo donax TaxID=35708 RepID=A0A0A8ZPA2_ARUDO
MKAVRVQSARWQGVIAVDRNRVERWVDVDGRMLDSAAQDPLVQPGRRRRRQLEWKK